MNLLEALFLGLVQGVTEWLPVSSTGHLVLVEEALGISASETVLFDLILHAATLLSVTLFLRRDIARILRALLADRSTLGIEDLRARRLGWLALLATLPAVAAGLLLAGHLERIFSPGATAVALLVTGAMLWTAELPRLRKRREELGVLDALMIGSFQALSVLPGISRSGATISAGCYMGLRRELLAVFSFLMSIPVIVAAIAYGSLFIEEEGVDWLVTLAAAAVAAISGYLALKWLFELIKKFRLRMFAIYCWAVGAIVLLLLHV